MFWPFVSAEQWQAYLEAQGINPETGVVTEPPLACEICKEGLIVEEVYLVLDPPPGQPFGRKFHVNCIVNHLCANIDNPNDDISNYMLRKFS